MGLFEHEDDEAKAAAKAAEEAAHPAPITIELGVQKAFDVELVVNQLLEEGCTLYLVDRGDLGESSELYPKDCRLLVKAEDEARVREVMTDAGFL